MNYYSKVDDVGFNSLQACSRNFPESFVSKFCAFSLFFVVSFVEMKDHVAHLALIQDFK